MNGDGLLRCAVGDADFAMRAGDVRHIARSDQLRHDDAPDGRAGSLKLGGQLIPVFELRQALGLPEAQEPARDDRYIAVTGDHEDLTGWMVDRIAREGRDGNTRILALPSSVGGKARRWYEGVVTSTDGDVMLLLSPRRLNPLRAAEPDPDDSAAAFTAPPRTDHPPSEPIALVFASPALPASDVDKFALSGRQVAAILQPSAPLDVPGCALHVAGLTFWRDVAVPVIDFRGARPREAHTGRQLIARCATDAHSLVALSIDADVLMHRPAADNRLLPEVTAPPFANGVFSLNGDRVALLDLDALIAGDA